MKVKDVLCFPLVFVGFLLLWIAKIIGAIGLIVSLNHNRLHGYWYDFEV